MHKILFKEKRSIILNSIKNFLIFSAFFLIFYFYHKTVIYDRFYLQTIVLLMILGIYLVSIFKLKIGFYIFVFLIPLLNTVCTIIGIRNVNIILYLFFALFLGFLINRFKSNDENDARFIYETEIAKPVLIFIIILVVSAAITIYRYANFVPFITSKFHDLTVNSAGHNSTGAITWTLRYLFYYIVGFGLIFIVFNILKTKKDFFITIAIIFSSSLIVIVAGFYQKYFNPGFGNISFWIDAGRVNSTFTDPNALGSYIILLFPLFISTIIFLKKWYLKLLTIIFLLLFLFLGVISASRNAFLSIIISVGIFAIIGLSAALRHFIKKKIKEPNKSALLSAGVIVLLIIIMISAFGGILLKTDLFDPIAEIKETGIILVDRVGETINVYYETLKSDGFYQAIRDISSGREILWRQAIYMFKDHPVSGVGQGAYFIEISDYHHRYHRGFHILDFAGNYYLQILSELGLVGIILILFIFFLIIKKSSGYFLDKNKNNLLKNEDWFLLGLLVSFISMLALFFLGPHTNFIEIQFLFSLIIGLIMAYIRINYKDDSNRKYTNNYLKIGCLRQIRFDLPSAISLLFIMVLFVITLLFGSTTDLSINIKQTLYDFENNYGFYSQESSGGMDFRWTEIEASEVIDREGNKIIIPVKSINPVKYEDPSYVKIIIDNSLMQKVVLKDKEWHNIEIDLKDFNKEEITLTFSMNHSWIPKETGLSNDTRELGIQVGEYRFID